MLKTSKLKIELIILILLSLVSLPSHSQSANDPNVVALFGDSITVGFNLSFRDIFANGTTTRGAPTIELRDILNRRARPSIVANWGIGGSSSGPGPNGRSNSGISRIRSNLSTTMNTHDGKDYYVLIMYGTNDRNSGIAASTTGFNVGEMIRLARLEGFTPIASTIPPIAPNPGFSIASYNNSIRSAVNAQNTPLVDNFSIFSGTAGSTFFDLENGFFVHPNDAGYQLIAQNWFDSALEDLISPNSSGAIAAIVSLLLSNDDQSDTTSE